MALSENIPLTKSILYFEAAGIKLINGYNVQSVLGGTIFSFALSLRNLFFVTQSVRLSYDMNL